ncbi:hypothetical protein B9Z55_003407 [Caenorhabditis nigoni]|nr:hypothetical protein B9Z55_003407 [Caenorhabditis nigoni]
MRPVRRPTTLSTWIQAWSKGIRTNNLVCPWFKNWLKTSEADLLLEVGRKIRRTKAKRLRSIYEEYVTRPLTESTKILNSARQDSLRIN